MSIASERLGIRKIDNVQELVRGSKHSGWCTKHIGDAKDYLANGQVYQFTKSGNRRPSYQLWFSESGYFELKGKCNVNISLSNFIEAYPEHGEFIGSIVLNLKKTCGYDVNSFHMTDAEIKAIVNTCIDDLDSMDTFAHLSYAEVDGIDSAGNSYNKNDRLIHMANGDFMVWN